MTNNIHMDNLVRRYIESVIKGDFEDAVIIFEIADTNTRYELDHRLSNIKVTKDTKVIRTLLKNYIEFQGYLVIY